MSFESDSADEFVKLSELFGVLSTVVDQEPQTSLLQAIGVSFANMSVLFQQAAMDVRKRGVANLSDLEISKNTKNEFYRQTVPIDTWDI